MKFTIEELAKESDRISIELLTNEKELSEIIRGWVNDQRSAVVIGGSSHIDETHRAYLLLEENRVQIASLYCAKDEILRHRPVISELIPPPLTRYSFDQPSSKLDKKFYKKQKRLLNPDWDEELQNDVVGLDAAVNAAIGLALSEMGQTTFCAIESSFVEEAEDPEIYLKNFLSVHMARADAKRINVECHDCYVDLRK